jgi:hypothetical protein
MSDKISFMQIGVSFCICGAIWGTGKDSEFYMISALMNGIGALFFIYALSN